jgi:hypothetical protein
MGNNVSSQHNNNLDYIATNYILSMNFQSLRKMHDKAYCNKLTGLTSTILAQYVKHKDIHFLLDRVKYGEKTIEKDTKTDNDTDKDITTEEKQQVCTSISVFYVKIAHIFAAIMMTLKPKYVFTDKHGKQIIIDIHDKSKIPKGIKPEIQNMGLCNNLLNILTIKSFTDKPKFCSRNKQGETLTEMPEFMELYYDSGYNFKTGNFEEMSPKMKNIFEKDLQSFYYHFSGNLIMPDAVKKFSDIKLKQYDNLNLCKNPKIEPIHYRNKLFAKYAANLKEMMIFVNNKQIALLNILDNLFITDEGDIRINPKITEHNIQDIIDSTRNNILELYLKCEDDFTENIKLHEAIIESLIILTTEGQIINLNELLQKSSEKTVSFDESTS